MVVLITKKIIQGLNLPPNKCLSYSPIGLICHKAKYFPEEVIVSLNINFPSPLPVYPLSGITRNVHDHKVRLMARSKRKCAIKRCK